jgi:hypothetical protein
MKLNYYPETDSLYIDLAEHLASIAEKCRRESFSTTTRRVRSSASISITLAGRSK